MESSRFETRITFSHVLILVAAVTLIGIILFYLGYRAGQTASAPPTDTSVAAAETKRVDEVRLNESGSQKPEKEKAPANRTISQELKLHQQHDKTETQQPTQRRGIISENYFTIQVGSFSDFNNAKKYAEKFRLLGYQSEIISSTLNNKKMYRVRVGSFPSRDEARIEMEKLEKLEKKTFQIVTSR